MEDTLRGSVIAAVGLAYFGVLATIALWAARRTRTPSDFYAAGRRLGVWTTGIASMAATISGFSFIGGPGLVYSMGLGALFIVLPLSVTAVMSAWVLGRRLYGLGASHGVFTIPGALRIRYGSTGAQGLAALAILLATIGYLATNMLALGVVLDSIFGLGVAAGVWVGMLTTLAYTAAGGILAGVYADVFQGGLMVAVSLAVGYYVLDAGGGVAAMNKAVLAVDPTFLAPWGKLTPLAALSFFFVFSVGTLGQPHVIHKFYMMRDLRTLKWYPAVMTGSMLLAQLLFVAVGLVMRSLVARGALEPLARPDDATPTFLLRFTPLPLAALAFSGVAAAIMSTVNSFLNVAAAAITHDIPAALGRRLRDELRWGRMATVLLALVAALVATWWRSLVGFLGIFGWGLFASTLVPALAIGLNWPGATRWGALASIGTGLAVTLSLESMAYFGIFRFPAGVTATALALLASLLAFVIVSLLAPRQRGPRASR